MAGLGSVWLRLHEGVGGVGVDGPGQLLLLGLAVEGVTDGVLGERLGLHRDVHHAHVVLLGHARAGRDGVRVAAVTLHGRHAEGLPHAPAEVGVVHRVQRGLGRRGAEGDPGHGREEQRPLAVGPRLHLLQEPNRFSSEGKLSANNVSYSKIVTDIRYLFTADNDYVEYVFVTS